MAGITSACRRFIGWAILLTVAINFSGCIGSDKFGEPEGTRPALYDREYAEYEWIDDRGEIVAKTEFSLTLDNGQLVGHLGGRSGLAGERFTQSEFSTLSGLNSTFYIDAATGTLQQIDHHQIQEWPMGIHQWLPEPSPAIASDFEFHPISGSTARLYSPLSAQWPLLAGLVGETAWGEALITSTVGADGWRVATEFECQYDCRFPDESGQRTIRLSMEGDRKGVLPARVAYELPGTDLGLVGTRTSHEVEGRIADVAYVAPVLDSVTIGQTCLELPCETAGWPARLSLEAGLESVKSSPAWLMWGGQDRTHPYYFAVLDGSIAMNQDDIVATIQWIFLFVDRETLQVESFGAAGIQLPMGVGATPPIPSLVANSDGGVADSIYAHPTDPKGMRAVMEYVPASLDELGFSMDSVILYEVSFPSALYYPDDRAAAVVVLFVEAPQGQHAILFSAVTGQLLSSIAYY